MPQVHLYFLHPSVKSISSPRKLSSFYWELNLELCLGTKCAHCYCGSIASTSRICTCMTSHACTHIYSYDSIFLYLYFKISSYGYHWCQSSTMAFILAHPLSLFTISFTDSSFQIFNWYLCKKQIYQLEYNVCIPLILF